MTMDALTKDSILEIERIHSAWIELEVTGEARDLLDFCAQDIELRPPDSPPVRGRDAVLAYLTRGIAKIHSIEISDRHLRGSNESVSLTAKFKTTFSLVGEPTSREAGGKPQMGTAEASRWLVVVVSWSTLAKKHVRA